MLEDFKPVRPKGRSEKPIDSEKTEEPAFKPPEVVAADEPATDPVVSTVAATKPWYKRKPRKKQVLTASAVAGVLLLVAAIPILALTRREAPAAQPIAVVTPKPPEPAKPTKEPSKLTGVEVPVELNKLPVTAVMIENSPDARPQAGLGEAGVVFEAISEGGITRFSALYQEAQPERIGPVRSVRPYYLDFIVPFDAPLAHAGGSAEALAQIRNEGIKDLDHSFNAGAYQRDSSRYAPHNLYTSRGQLLGVHNAKGWTSSTFTSFTRKKDAASQAPNARAIDLSISSFLYNPHFDYDAASNSYKRVMAGKPHMDERTGAQISPKVVLALVMPHRYQGIYSVYGTTGSGKLYAFQDGMVTEGTWSKAGRSSQFVFADAAGNPLALNAGQTWISIVSRNDAVKFVP